MFIELLDKPDSSIPATETDSYRRSGMWMAWFMKHGSLSEGYVKR